MNTQEHPQKSLLEVIVKALVSKIDEVSIIHTVDDLGDLLTLRVAKEDMGKVIGREGAISKAIRTVLKAASLKSDPNSRVNLKIVEPHHEDLDL